MTTGNYIWSGVGFVGGIIVTGVIGFLLEPVGNWFKERAGPWIGREETYVIPISTRIQFCQTGDVSNLLARPGEAPSAQLMSGADRALICDNGAMSGSKPDFAQIISNTYPGCFSILFNKSDTILSLQGENDAVCRAPYRVQDWRLEPASYEQGVNICLGQAGRTSQFKSSSRKGQPIPRQCSDEELRTYGFLP